MRQAAPQSQEDWDFANPENEFQFFDDDDEEDRYQSHEDLMRGLTEGRLLVHTRRPDDTDFSYGIDPSAGEFLRGTESWQTAEEMHGSGPELTFFSDGKGWAKDPYTQAVFVRKHPSIQQSLGNGRVRTHDGREIPYVMSDMADHEDPIYQGEPAGVESSDWYTKENQPVVGIIRRR